MMGLMGSNAGGLVGGSGEDESAPCSSHCSDSARKDIERQMRGKLSEQGDYAKGYAAGCKFAIDVFEEFATTPKQREVDRVLDRISRMEDQIDTVELFTDPRLAEMYSRWKDTLEEAWNMINEQAR